MTAMTSARNATMKLLALPTVHVGLLALLAGGIYVQTLTGEFIWDDSGLIVDRSDYFEAARNIVPLFTDSPLSSAPYYRPFLWLSFLADYALWHHNPWGFHLTNILLHMLNTVMLYVALRVLPAPAPLCAATSALFAVHPINTEAVAWIAGRNDPLMMLCILLTCLMFCKAATVSRKKAALTYAFVSGLCYAAGLLVKESAVIALPLLLIIDRCIQTTGSRFARMIRLSLYAAMLLISTAFFFVQQTFFQGTALRLNFQPHIHALSFVCAVYLYYLKTLLFPINLTVDPSFFIPCLTDPIRAALYPIVFAAVLAVPVWCRSWWREGAAAMAWVLVYLLPVSGIIWMGVPILEHRAYGACAGFCFCLASLWYRSAYRSRLHHRRVAKCVASGALCAVLLLYGALTVQRNRFWQNELLIWTDTYAKSPWSAQAMVNLGVALLRRNQPEQALDLFYKARERYPYSSRVYNNIGAALSALGKYDEARAALQQALRCDPNSAEAYTNLGIFYRDRGEIAQAISCFEKAHALNPSSVTTVQQLARLYLQQGDPDRAIAMVRSALAHVPRNSLLHNELGKALQQVSRSEEALESFKAAVQYDPSNCDALNNLSLLYLRQGKFRQALPYTLRAVHCKPEAPELHMNCGIIYMNLGMLPDAAAAYERAIRLNPAYADAYFNLGVTLMMMKKDRQRIRECFEKVLDLQPDYPNKDHVLKIIEELKK